MILKGAAVLTGGQVLRQSMSFFRNIIVARLLIPEEFGIAAMLVISVSMLDMTGNLSVDRLLVQAEDGDDPEFQATTHTFQVLRGIALSIIMLGLAWPLSRLLGVSHALWAFQCLALVPLVRGFAHLDPKRLHRKMYFSRDVLVEIVSQVVMLLLAWPLAEWLRNYSVMVWLLLAHAFVYTLATHILAFRPYRLQCDTKYARRMLHFGWPLAINSVLIFVIFQGDKMIIGGMRGPAMLAVYAIALSLTMVPVAVVAKINATIFLPIFSNSKRDANKFEAALRNSSQITSTLASVFSVIMIVVGGRIIVLLYGEQYSAASQAIEWLGAMQAVRLMRSVPSQAAIALGETKNPMYANVARNFAILGMITVAYYDLPLQWFAISAFGGELVALFVATVLLSRMQGIPIAAVSKYSTVGLICMGTTGLVTNFSGTRDTVGQCIFTLLLSISATLVAFGVSNLSRRHIIESNNCD